MSIKRGGTPFQRYASFSLAVLLAACGGGSPGDDAASGTLPHDRPALVVQGAPLSDNLDQTAPAAPANTFAATAVTGTAPANSCNAGVWVAGKSYAVGATVYYAPNGRYYAARYANPGYDPTISTWFWAAATCTPISAPTPAPAGNCTAATWTRGTYYAAGTKAYYPANGKYYLATNANPGYDPTISTWFWSPTTCGTTTTAPSPAPSGFPFTEAQFNQMFPNRNSFYTYSGLVTATSAYPAIFGGATGKQEAAAFLANIKHETGSLVYVREVNQANWSHYCGYSNQYPCASGQQYYGRGPIQLSWNYNYGAAGAALGLPLLQDPDLVARDATVAWKTAIWFWMTQTGAGRMTAHAAIANGIGFGETIRTINGALECNQPAGSIGNNQMQTRVRYFQEFATLLGTTTGSNLSC